MLDVRSPALRKLLKQVTWDKASCSCYRVVGLVPLPLIDIVQDMEEVALLKGQFLWCIRFVGRKGTNDLLWRLYGGARLGECRKGASDGVLFVAIKRFA